MERHKNSASITIPTSDRGLIKFFTPLIGIKRFADGKRSYVYFHPATDKPTDMLNAGKAEAVERVENA